MVEIDNKIYAPKIDPRIAWQMPEKEFNDWREKNDYPRIIKFLKKKLPEFEVWMEDQKLSDNILIKHLPSTFLRKRLYIYLYTVLDSEKKEKEILSEAKYSVGETFFYQNFVKQRKEIKPYPIWYQQKTKQSPPEVSVNYWQGRNCFILSELELLDLGNCHLANMFIIGKRHLDFTNISDLRLTNCRNNKQIHLWFCSAINVTVEGDLTFVDAYHTSFCEGFSQKFRNLKLLNGTFQSWSFENCEVSLTASNATLHLWEFSGWDLNGTISNSDIRDCNFKNSVIRYPIEYERAKIFHSHIKRLYSQIGKKKEASQHYYWEKTYERKSFLHLRENYRNQYYKAKTKISKILLKTIYFFKYLYSGLLNILWGYGERPARVFLISIATILIFAFVYCYLPNASSDTRYNFTNSLYYSMVTFTTLGYGDIHQSNELLKLMSGFEALLGMTFWGILIAGFTSNAKDY